MALIGISPNYPQSDRICSEIFVDDLLNLLAGDAVVAVAASADLLNSTSIHSPVCCSIIGAWVEWLVEVLGRGGKVTIHSALNFINTDPSQKLDEFSLKIDEINLFQKLYATKYSYISAAAHSKAIGT